MALEVFDSNSLSNRRVAAGFPVPVAPGDSASDVSGAFRVIDPFHHHTHLGEAWSF